MLSDVNPEDVFPSYLQDIPASGYAEVLAEYRTLEDNLRNAKNADQRLANTQQSASTVLDIAAKGSFRGTTVKYELAAIQKSAEHELNSTLLGNANHSRLHEIRVQYQHLVGNSQGAKYIAARHKAQITASPAS
ncbi:hypothetical protein JCM16303_007307 [Sporobolomyces ruberrimus]